MPEAVVKWFSATKGFGFATPKDGGDDVFLHQSHINMDGFRKLNRGQTCSYEPANDDKGREKAINIVPQ
jgi:cold shock CspA family protein